MANQSSTSTENTNGMRRFLAYGGVVVVSALVTVVVLALLLNIFARKQEAQQPFVRVVEVNEHTIDPSIWGANWPHQYDSYMQTVDYERTAYGGSDAVSESKLEADPWLRTMWAGYAFSIDYREARGHAYMLMDQEETERVRQRPQPGACLHCHSSIVPAYREVGNGDIHKGFEIVNAMSWEEARNLTGGDGELLIQHPVACLDCHDPDTMELRITRPAFIEGIRNYMMAQEGINDYDVNRDASRHEMRTFACAQCHVEYYFTKPGTQLTYPWENGMLAGDIEAYYDNIDFADWTHAETGAKMLKAQHPEFELWSQGIHARAGVACADCHMPYQRVGAMKVSDHDVRSPLLDIASSCQTCHNVSENELMQRAVNNQQKTRALIDRASVALTDMIEAIVAARKAGATDEQLAEALRLHRRAQWRLDFIYSENSEGFHAPQEAAKVLAESIDFSRQAVAIAQRAAASPAGEPQEVAPGEVQGVTPRELSPPQPDRDRNDREDGG